MNRGGSNITIDKNVMDGSNIVGSGQAIFGNGTVAPLASPVTVWIGNGVADVQWKGMTGAGLWQLNVVIPKGLPAGDNALVADVGGVRTQPGVFISIAGGVL